MVRFVSIVTVAALAMLLPMEASAQDRRKDEDACGRDATRFCKAVINDGDYAILNCLKTNRARLRPVCVKHLQDAGQLY